MLESSRVILVPLDGEDISDEYIQWFNDPDTFRYLGTKFGQTKSTIKTYVQSIKPPNLICKIIVKPDRQYVGNIGLQHFDLVHRRMELGIVIGVAAARGQGIGKQACSLMIKYAFEHLNVHKVTAGTVAENTSMDKVFRDLGFKVEGKFIEHWYVENKYHDVYRYGLLGPDFKPVL